MTRPGTEPWSPGPLPNTLLIRPIIRIRYSPAKLDNRVSQNLQDIRRSQKVYRGYHEKLESGIDNRKKKLS